MWRSRRLSPFYKLTYIQDFHKFPVRENKDLARTSAITKAHSHLFYLYTTISFIRWSSVFYTELIFPSFEVLKYHVCSFREFLLSQPLAPSPPFALLHSSLSQERVQRTHLHSSICQNESDDEWPSLRNAASYIAARLSWIHSTVQNAHLMKDPILYTHQPPVFERTFSRNPANWLREIVVHPRRLSVKGTNANIL